MISKKMEKALNRQINAELYSSYLYLAMAAHAESKNLRGMANWFRVQSQEELVHATKFFGFVHERGGRVTLEAIEKPPVEWSSPKALFESGLAHERKVTGLISDLVNLAVDERDHATNNFLQFFVAEQVEEETNADAIVRRLELAQDSGPGLFMIDNELAARTFVYPTPLKGAAQ